MTWGFTWQGQLNFLKLNHPDELDEITIAELKVKGEEELEKQFDVDLTKPFEERQAYAKEFRQKHNLD
ncbi:hypothetical protein ANSO36C_67460 (plasmid) [Nostoc cf. commune SO-36]|uniref:Uncharacterized protein n=1 Tax=Nostoc cf. commune SO-36 TaxID=449208 RepID=A0ABN6QGN5_NOSCO|nr:hypothetical protein [Nostoc commune]BDI20944.1 hypothetical protein ANSO36C_67460 [Nostoc cf. commune SO-36]